MMHFGWCLVVLAIWIKCSDASSIFNEAVSLSDASYNQNDPMDAFVFNNGTLRYLTKHGNMSVYDLSSKSWTSRRYSIFPVSTTDYYYTYFSLGSTMFLTGLTKKVVNGVRKNLWIYYWNDATNQVVWLSAASLPAFNLNTAFVYIADAVPDHAGNIAYLTISAYAESKSEVVFVKVKVDFGGSFYPKSATIEPIIPEAVPLVGQPWSSIVTTAADERSLYAVGRYWTSGKWSLDFNTAYIIDLKSEKPHLNVTSLDTRTDIVNPFTDNILINNRLFVFGRHSAGESSRVTPWMFDLDKFKWQQIDYTFPTNIAGYLIAFDHLGQVLYMKPPNAGLFSAQINASAIVDWNVADAQVAVVKVPNMDRPDSKVPDGKTSNDTVAKAPNVDITSSNIDGKVVLLSDNSYATSSPPKDFFLFNKGGPMLIETQSSNISQFDLVAKQWSSKIFTSFNLKTDNKQRAVDIFSMNSYVFMAEALKKDDEIFVLQLSYWDEVGGQFKKIEGDFQTTIMDISYVYIVTTVPDPSGNIAYMAVTSTKATESEAVFVKVEVTFDARLKSPIKATTSKIGSITLGHSGERCGRYAHFNSGSNGPPPCITWNKYQAHEAAFDVGWPTIGYLAVDINTNTLNAFVRYYDDKQDDEDIEQFQGPWAKGARAKIPRYSWLKNGIWLLDFNTVLTINLASANTDSKPVALKMATRNDYLSAYGQAAVIKDRVFVFDRQFFEDRSDKMTVWAYKLGENAWSSIGDFAFPSNGQDYVIAYDQKGDQVYLKKEDAGLYVTRMKN